MGELIREIILTTRRPDGGTHIAPMGVRERGDRILIAPFKPSGTLDNLLREGSAVLNLTDDVRVYAGCLTGRRDWPLAPTEMLDEMRLRDALGHEELVVDRVEADDLRPRLYCRVVHAASHGMFRGFNRAQAAVLELAILASRLDRLPPEKVRQEMEYLRIALDKTAGAREREAWEWLEQKVAAHMGSFA